MKAATRLLYILAILGALSSGAFYYLSKQNRGNLAEELENVSAQLAQAKQKAEELEGTQKELSRELDSASQALKEAQSNITITAARNNQLKRETRRYSDELDSLLEREETLQAEVARLNRALAETRATTVSLDDVAAYERKISALQAEVLNLQNTQLRFPSSAAASASSPTLNGKVLTVGPQASFVILNIGYQEGARLSRELSIMRGNQTIAQALISEVKESLSIARVMPETLKSEPQAGDIVTTQQ